MLDRLVPLRTIGLTCLRRPPDPWFDDEYRQQSWRLTVVNSIALSPMHSGKLNSTQLNSTQLFSSVQFSFPLCIEPATIRRRNRRSSQVLHNRDRPTNAMSVVGRKPATSCDDSRLSSQVCRRPSPVLDCQEPATVVPGRRRFNAQRKTELN